MSVPLGNRTKKVTTYGKRNTRIVSLYRDLTPERPTASSSACSPAISTRPVLGSKASYENIPPTPIRAGKSGLGKATTLDSDVDSPAPRLVPRRRFGRPIIPATPSTVTTASSPPRHDDHSLSVAESSPPPAAAGHEGGESSSCVRPAREMMVSVEIPVRQKREATRRAPETAEDTLLVQKLDSLGIADKFITPARASRSPETESSLARLTAACTSPEIISFSAVLSALGLYLPNSPPGQSLNVTKAGEASYSEVYAVTTRDCDPIMIKIIPIHIGEKAAAVNDDTPELSDPLAVAQEVMVTQRMSGLKGGGFVHFHAAYVVKGAYTLQLLKQWDAYKTKWGSDNHRPSCFGKEQHYAVLCLSDGGLDLESFAFDSKVGWRQAAGVFWQAADALARAEAWTSFEHRDLHEGQILIDTVESAKGKKAASPMDYSSPAATGIKITIIDFGLSRLEDATGGTLYAPIPDNIMDGEGAQWDVYRAMKELVAQGDWEEYRPKTNVMWLRYILDYIFTNTPSLIAPTPPAARRGTKAHLEAQAAVAAHEALLRAKVILDASCTPVAAKKRGKSGAAGGAPLRVEDAQALVQWGRGEGFLGAR